MIVLIDKKIVTIVFIKHIKTLSNSITEIRKPLNILSLCAIFKQNNDFGVVFQPSARASRFESSNHNFECLKT